MWYASGVFLSLTPRVPDPHTWPLGHCSAHNEPFRYTPARVRGLRPRAALLVRVCALTVTYAARLFAHYAPPSRRSFN